MARRRVPRQERLNGDFIAAFGTPAAQGDRSLPRRRQRAFDLLGLRELEPNFYVRPDNLIGGAAAVRERLGKLGVDADGCGVFLAKDFDAERDRRQGPCGTARSSPRAT